MKSRSKFQRVIRCNLCVFSQLRSMLLITLLLRYFTVDEDQLVDEPSSSTISCLSDVIIKPVYCMEYFICFNMDSELRDKFVSGASSKILTVERGGFGLR